MLTRTLVIRMLLSSIIGIITFSGQSIIASDNIELYTPNTKISIPPGESVSYNIDVVNKSQVTKKCNISITDIPKTWNYFLKSGAYNIQQISILPGEKKTLSLKIEIPLKVNKGNYYFNVNAGGATLKLIINVSKQGSYETEFTSEQANMEGHSKSTFSFKTNLKNRTGEKQLYSLKSKTPRGWRVTFKPDYKQATSVEIEPNKTKIITIDITPPQNISAGIYKIPVTAMTNFTSADLELEVVVTGTYEMEMNTPSGLVSTRITAGSEKKTELIITNTGSALLSDVKLNASKPSGWEVTFEPKEVTSIESGKQANIVATIKAAKKAIAGDYVTNINATTPEVSSKLTFRVSVKTPMIWGWVGILIIFIAIGSIIYLFRKYGRR